MGIAAQNSNLKTSASPRKNILSPVLREAVWSETADPVAVHDAAGLLRW